MILATIVIVLVVVSILLITKQKESKYPQEPIKFSSLSVTTKDINIDKLKNMESKDIPLYSVMPSDGDINIDEIIQEIGISFLSKDITGTDPKIWSNGEDIFRYYAFTDTLVFQLKDGIEFEKTDSVLKDFFRRYLGVTYDFDIVEEKTTSTGGVRIYGRRQVENIPIEIGFGDEYSDYLEFNKSGNLIGGQILLTEFQNEEAYVPTVSNRYLKEVINKDVYPKEMYLNTSILSSSIDLYYLDDAWGDIEESGDNCNGSEQEIVFLYKNIDQKYLIPIYKISGNCEVKYKENSYNVPSTFYVLAGDPEYIVRE